MSELDKTYFEKITFRDALRLAMHDSMKEDDKIRNYLTKLPKINSISNIRINRDTLNNRILLDIETGKPGILTGEFGKDFKCLIHNIKNLLPVGRKLTISVSEVKEIDLNANPLGDLVVEKL